jgi:hypothetical protein
LYAGYENTDQKAETIGTLATLIDFRDGTNLTGLNPDEERLIRHIGFSGHASPAVMIEMIHRDTRKVLEGMLVAINANDRNYFNMQYNIIPVAQANNMGIIAMKLFADGAMYEKPAVMTQGPHMVVRRVGSEKLPSRKLIEYSLTTPGIGTAIIGTGHIDNDPKACQLTQNLLSAQILPDAYTISDRREVERLALSAKEGKTNGFFQVEKQGLSSPRDFTVEQENRDQKRVARLTWQTSYAGDELILRYEIWRDNRMVGQVDHTPQITSAPFIYEEILTDKGAHKYSIVTVDTDERTAKTEEILIAGM